MKVYSDIPVVIATCRGFRVNNILPHHLGSLIAGVLLATPAPYEESGPISSRQTVAECMVEATLEMIGVDWLSLCYPLAEGTSNRFLSRAYQVSNFVIHPAIGPDDDLLKKVRLNLDEGLRPVVIDCPPIYGWVLSFARTFEVEFQISSFELGGFVEWNVGSAAVFSDSHRISPLSQFVGNYNRAIEARRCKLPLKILPIEM